MAGSTVLSIQGYRGEPVPNRFQRPEGATDRLAVLLPGLGYTLDMPLFYYTEDLVLARGWDILRVEYAYNRPEFQEMPQAERARWLLADATAAYRAGLAQGQYESIALIGKSLGTLAMGHLLTMADQPAAASRAVWLTPLLGNDRLREQIGRFGGPSLFVIGTADPHYDAAILEEVRAATDGETVVVPDADHGMDVPGDAVASVHAVARVVAALAEIPSGSGRRRRRRARQTATVGAMPASPAPPQAAGTATDPSATPRSACRPSRPLCARGRCSRTRTSRPARR